MMLKRTGKDTGKPKKKLYKKNYIYIVIFILSTTTSLTFYKDIHITIAKQVQIIKFVYIYIILH